MSLEMRMILSPECPAAAAAAVIDTCVARAGGPRPSAVRQGMLALDEHAPMNLW